MKKKLKKSSRNISLSDLINALPSDDLSNADLRSLLLQLVLDTPNDDKDKHYANKARVKLEAIKLLIDVNRNDSVSDYEAELLNILGDDADKE